MMISKEKSQRTDYAERYRLQFHMGQEERRMELRGEWKEVRTQPRPAWVGGSGDQREVAQVKTYELMN